MGTVINYKDNGLDWQLLNVTDIWGRKLENWVQKLIFGVAGSKG